MKTPFLTPLLFLLFSFTTNSSSKEIILFKSEKGCISFKKDFLLVNFDTESYLNKISFIEILVFLDKKIYLGSVSEAEYNVKKINLIEKYQKVVKEKYNFYNYSKKILRVENKSGRCYFFYYDQLVELDFGTLMSDGRYCVGGYKGEYQIKEKNIIVTMYMDGVYKYGEKVFKDKNDAITSRKDFALENQKTAL